MAKKAPRKYRKPAKKTTTRSRTRKNAATKASRKKTAARSAAAATRPDRGRGLHLAAPRRPIASSRTCAAGCVRGRSASFCPRDGAGVPARGSRGATAEDVLIDQEDQAELERVTGSVLARLSERQRQIVVLYSHGRRRPEIAEHLGVTPRSVKRALERILAVGQGRAAAACGARLRVGRVAGGAAGVRAGGPA